MPKSSRVIMTGLGFLLFLPLLTFWIPWVQAGPPASTSEKYGSINIKNNTELGKKAKRMAKKIISNFTPNAKTKRPNVHSKNASVGQKGYKKKYRGQGR